MRRNTLIAWTMLATSLVGCAGTPSDTGPASSAYNTAVNLLAAFQFFRMTHEFQQYGDYMKGVERLYIWGTAAKDACFFVNVDLKNLKKAGLVSESLQCIEQVLPTNESEGALGLRLTDRSGQGVGGLLLGGLAIDVDFLKPGSTKAQDTLHLRGETDAAPAAAASTFIMVMIMNGARPEHPEERAAWEKKLAAWCGSPEGAMCSKGGLR